MSTCHGCFPFCQGRSWGVGRALPVPHSGPGRCPRAECVHEPDSQRWWGRCTTWCLDPWCLCSPPVALPRHASTGGGGIQARQAPSALCGGLGPWQRQETKPPVWKCFGKLEPAVCLQQPPPPRPARGTPVARSDSAVAHSGWPHLPSLVVTRHWPSAPQPGTVLMGPHSCSTRVPGHQLPDRRAAGGQGAQRARGQWLQLSGQQVRHGLGGC